MLEFFILLVMLLVMAMTGFTLVAMLLVSGLFVLLGVLGGMLALIIKLAPLVAAGAGGLLAYQQPQQGVKIPTCSCAIRCVMLPDSPFRPLIEWPFFACKPSRQGRFG